MANQKGTTVYLTHPRTIVFLVLLAIFVIGSAAEAIVTEYRAHVARRNMQRIMDALPTPQPTILPNGWGRLRLDVVAMPNTEAMQRFRDKVQQGMNERMADEAATADWDARVERANLKLHRPGWPMHLTAAIDLDDDPELWDYEAEQLGYTDLTAVHTVDTPAMRVMVYTGEGNDEGEYGVGVTLRDVWGEWWYHLYAAPTGTTAHPLRTLEMWNCRPTSSIGWAE